MKHPLRILCDSGVHCDYCRKPENGQWRADVAAAYEVPATWPDCPQGKAMGERQPESIPSDYDPKKASFRSCCDPPPK